MPRSSATTMYIASSVDAVALIVIDVDTLSSGMPSSSVCMSSTVSIATPTRPTSPSARGESESIPICVGRSNATLSPVWPGVEQHAGTAGSSRRAVPKPAYWRIVQRRPRYIVGWTPRVNGNLPGSPRSRIVIERLVGTVNNIYWQPRGRDLLSVRHGEV